MAKATIAAPAARKAAKRSNKPKAPALPKRIRDLQTVLDAECQLSSREVAEVETWARKHMTVQNRSIVARIALRLTGGAQ